MRKILFSAIALMMSVTLWAAGAADSSKAINFDWDGENQVKAGTTVEYSLGLQDLVNRANEPVIALYLNNLTTSPANVAIVADAALHLELPFVGKRVYAIDGFSDPKNYTIAGEGHEIWTLPTTFDLTDVVNSNSALKNLFEDPKNVSLIDLCVNYGLTVSLKVTTNQLISISTSVYEKEEIVDDLDYACAESESFEWTKGATVNKGEKWLYLDLKKINDGEKLNFVVENANGTEAQVSFDLYLDCPTTAKILAHVWDIPANADKKESLGRFLLNQISSDYVYLKLTTNQTVTLKVETEKLPDPTPADNLFDATAATTWNGEKLQLEAGAETIVKVEKAALKAEKGYKTVAYVTNLEDVETTLTQIVSFEPVATIYNTMEKTLSVAAIDQAQINISNKMLDNVKSDVAYFCFKANGRMQITIKQVELESSSNVKEPTIYAPACDEAWEFNWNETIKLKALQQKWYEFDIKPLKQNNEQVQLSFTNHSDSMAIVMGSILLDCNSTDTIPYVLPLPAGKTVSKVLDYSLLAASPLEKVYVSAMMIPTAITGLSDLTSIRNIEDVKKLISLDLNAQVSLTATKSSAYVDPALCENTHETLQAGVKYTQAAGTTQWYHVTDKFIKDMGLLSTFAIGNNGKAAANVTLGVTVGCNHGIHTRTSVSIPTWLDVTTIYPNGLFNLVDAIVNEDITEFYLEVTTDQPIEFGFGVEIENKLGCDNAADFDWSKGVTFEPNAPHWYKFDISELKANKEQVKLTFSNPTNSWAWVAAFATYDCPFKVGLPLVFPVPANTTVDKWIDYSFLASTPKEDLYFLVYTDSPLQLKAEKETAKVTPTTDCTNAIVVEPNTPYTIQPGTSWYKLSPAPFAKATGKSAKISFANNSGKTAKVTTGATVGCEYGILTRGKFPVPAMNVDVNVPLWVFGLLKQFVDEDVNQYYVEVTTDQPLNFQIDVELAAKDTTVYGYACQGERLFHPVTGKEITDDFQKQTTITYVKDNVNYTHVFTPLVAGGKVGVDVDLNSIKDGKPVLKAGEKPVVDASIAAIQNYYKSLQTATDSVTEKEIKWVVIGQKENSEDTIHVAITDTTIVPLCATSLKMRLVITDECNNGANLSGDFEFTVDNNYGQAADAGVKAEDIKVFCGQAIDVDEANEIIAKFIKDNEVGPNAKPVWEEKNAEGNWVKMSLDAIPGTIDSVTVRYTIKTDYKCNIFVHDGFTLKVETPTYKNDPEDMAHIELVSRYGDRLLTVHIKSITEKFGWNVAEEDVTWYKEGEDQPVGTGYYLTTPDGASLAAGTYYALIEHTAVDSTDCDGTLSTIMHEVKAVANGPKLAPSAVQPQELITIFNLNAEQVSNISIYRSTGEKLESFQVNKQEQTTFNAAQQTGIYLVEILTETEKVTLRYIVK